MPGIEKEKQARPTKEVKHKASVFSSILPQALPVTVSNRIPEEAPDINDSLVMARWYHADSVTFVIGSGSAIRYTGSENHWR
jgi:hypothetical protein